MGLQIPYRHNTEISEKKVIRATSQTRWRSDPRFMPSTGDRDVGRALNAGAYPYVFEHSPKIQRCICNRIHKSKSAVRIHRHILGNARVTGLHFWAQGYCVSTVGLDEETIRKYIRDQEKLEKRQEELKFKYLREMLKGLSQVLAPFEGAS